MSARRATAAVLLTLAACAGDDVHAPGSTDEPALVETAAARPVAAQDHGWVGVTAPAEAVDVAPAFEGVVAAITVRPGDRITAGAELARLDERLLREELDAVRAQVREAGAAARRAAVEVERAQYRLRINQAGFAAGTEPASVVEDARLEVRADEAAAAQARAAHAETKARLERAINRLGDTAIRAPFAGTIGLRYADVGAAVGPHVPVVRLVGGGRARLRFAIPMAEVTRVVPGTRVIADLRGRAPLPARVATVSPEADQASQLVYVDAEFAADLPDVPPGVPASVRLGDEGLGDAK